MKSRWSRPQGQPLAAFVCPGHPLLDAAIDLTLERHRDLLRRGTVLVDDRDPGMSPRVLFFLEHAIQDAGITRTGDRRIVSKRMLYVEIDAEGHAPTSELRTLSRLSAARTTANRTSKPSSPGPSAAWIGREMEQKAQGYAIANVVPEHLDEVRSRKLELLARPRPPSKTG